MTKDEGLWTMDYGSVEKSSNRLIFSEKNRQKGHFFSFKNGRKTAKIKKNLFEKWAISSFAFPFFLEVFTVDLELRT
jgi:hypothetical protein